MQLLLHGNAIKDRNTLHAFLKQGLAFPDYYGNNLDALYDVLTERTEPLEIKVEHAEELKEILCGYGEAFMETLLDAAAENESVKVEIVNN